METILSTDTPLTVLMSSCNEVGSVFLTTDYCIALGIKAKLPRMQITRDIGEDHNTQHIFLNQTPILVSLEKAGMSFL